MADQIDKTVKLRYIVEDDQAVNALENVSGEMVAVGASSEELSNQIYQLNEALYATADAQVQAGDSSRRTLSVESDLKDHHIGIGEAILARRVALVAWSAVNQKWQKAILLTIGRWGALAASIAAAVAVLVTWNAAAQRSATNTSIMGQMAANLNGIWEDMLDLLTPLTEAYYELFSGTILNAAGEFEFLMRGIRDDMRELEVETAKTNLVFAEQQNILAETNRTNEERLAAADKIIEIVQRAETAELNLAQRRLDARRELNRENAASREDLDEERRLQIELYQIQIKGEQRVTTVLTQRANLQKQIAAENLANAKRYEKFISTDLANAESDLREQRDVERKIIDDAQKQSEKDQKAAFAARRQSLEDEFSYNVTVIDEKTGLEKNYNEELKILREQEANDALARNADTIAKREELDRAYYKKLRELRAAEAAAAAAEEEAARESAFAAAVESEAIKSRQALNKLAQERLEDTAITAEQQADAVFAIEEKRLVDTIAIYKKFGKDVSALELELNQARLANRDKDSTQLEEKLDDDKLTWQDYADSIGSIAQNVFQAITDLAGIAAQKQIEELDRVSEVRIANAQGNADEIAEIEEEQEKKRKEILTKQAKQEKANAIFGIILNTVLGVIKAAPAVPLMAATAAAGAAALAVAAARPIPTFRDGGSIKVGGNGHQDGGTTFTGTDGSQFEAESGETISIHSRNTSDRLGGLDGINRANFAGAASRDGNVNSVDEYSTRVYVTESDIAATGRRVAAVESASTL